MVIRHPQLVQLSIKHFITAEQLLARIKMDILSQDMEVRAALEHMARSFWTLSIDLWTGASVELWSCLIIQAGMSFFMLGAVSEGQK